MFKKFLTVSIVAILSFNAFAQRSTGEIVGKQNVVRASVPFMIIAPDTRAGGMGDVGAATSPDINSMHWNPAKYAFTEEQGGISISYTPWLRYLIQDISLSYLAGYWKHSDRYTSAASLRYFSLGEIDFTDEIGNFITQHTPNELALDYAFAMLLSEKTSMSVALRFIRSDLTGGRSITGGVESKAGISYAADVSYYHVDKLSIDSKPAELAFGANISNMGTKISYTSDNQREEFIPTTLRLGSRLTSFLDDYNSLAFALDLSKLLVPTTSQTDVDSNNVELEGLNNVSMAEGMILSLHDAPGGLREELNEIMIAAGLEYWYRDQFAIRGGYFYEHVTKGNRKYFSVGIGLKLNVFGLDFSYLVPTSGTSPLQNTMRFSINFEFE